MHRYRRWIRTEMDVEFFACVHGMSMILIYGFLLWLTGEAAVPFAIIFEMLVLGYLMSWTQKVLFLKEKTYQKREYQMREILWCLLPILYMPITGTLFHWFSETSVRIEVAFYVIMICYFIIVWVFLRCFHEEDTEELNQLLKKRKGGEKE